LTDRARAGLPPTALPLQETGKRILAAMTAAVDPEQLIHRAVKRRGDRLCINAGGVHLPDYCQVHCLGAGKAAAAMYRGLLPMIRDRLAGGILVAPAGAPDIPGPVFLLAGDHPIPGRRSLARVIRRFQNSRAPRAWVFGGETTAHVKGNGRGGRNQELALRLLTEVRDLPGPWYAACMGSDGIDGNSPAAGAWISHESARLLVAQKRKLDLALRQNDSYRFFRRFGGLIQTGPTGTNVMDLGVILIAPGRLRSRNPERVR